MKMFIDELNIDRSDLNSYPGIFSQEGSLFNSPEWISLFDDNLKLYGIFNDDKSLIGGFYLFVTRIAGLRYYKSPPFTPHVGLFFKNNAVNTANRHSYIKRTITLVAEFISNLPYTVVSLPFPNDYIDFQPFYWMKFKVIPNYTYIINLNKPYEDISKNMSPQRRNDLTKANKDNIITLKIDDMSVVKELVLKTMNRNNITYNLHILDKILFSFTKYGNSFAFVSYISNIPIATSFCVYDKNTAYYLLGGIDFVNKHQGAGAAAVFSTIQFSRNLNLKYYNFEGSMIPSVENFFRNFGGEMTPYFRINKAILPVEFILKLFKRNMF
ncbi:MAG: hypothetical protein HY738_14525 [Bacteroidia bacterium]|nr:hypothetical protein [Bacteroidia bacterium]